MIISASRRTDIPNYYSDWLFNRLKEGFVQVRNPFNPHQVSELPVNPEVVDCMVFWSKNPAPMLLRLSELKAYKYYFQFTLNPYGKDIEPGVPSKNNEIIDTFKRLSDKISPNRVIWRYDPIFLNRGYSLTYHIKYFGKLARALEGYTNRCVISFIDFYRSISNNFKNLSINQAADEDIIEIAKSFSEIAGSCGFELATCSEEIELAEYRITHASCIDKTLIENITGYPLDAKKDKKQRPGCGCVESVDIGAYSTCINGCKYCYANHRSYAPSKAFKSYDPKSPLLCSKPEAGDKITRKSFCSFKSTT